LCSAYASFKHDLRSVAADHYVVKSADLHELKRKIEISFEGMRTYEPQPQAITRSSQRREYSGRQFHDHHASER
jgi:hypothetical protein